MKLYEVLQGKPVATSFWDQLHKDFPSVGIDRLPDLFLSKYKIEYTSPSKGHYQIQNIDPSKALGIIFYPKSGRIVIQLLGKNRALPFVSDNPVVLANKIKSFL